MADVLDCIIIGDGAAGLSAALVLGRARRRTLVLGAGEPRNAPAKKMHGFFSREGTSPTELLQIGRDQLTEYTDVTVGRHKVIAVEREADGFVVRTESGEHHVSKRILLATGVRDVLPTIEGIAPLWGTHVFTCPYCDGWEFRDRKVAVVGPRGEAIGLAREIFRWSKDLVVVATDWSQEDPDDAPWFERYRPPLVSSPIARFAQSSIGVRIEFSEAEPLECAVVFLSAPLRQRSKLPAALGCRLGAEGEILVDAFGRTDVAGCYAAGDAVNHRHQVIQAAAGGAAAAMTINEDLIELES